MTLAYKITIIQYLKFYTSFTPDDQNGKLTPNIALSVTIHINQKITHTIINIISFYYIATYMSYYRWDLDLLNSYTHTTHNYK
jgi:hypothetical protein